jgi:fatty-acyl-CoA synthase
MMDNALTLRHMFDYSQNLFAEKEIVSRTSHGIFRYRYADFGRRTRQLARALAELGVKPQDRVGTFAWNDYRHLEAYFAIPCMGSVLHTINIRLSAEHLIYIINHAEDKVLLIDASLVPVIEALSGSMPTVQAYIIMGGSDQIAQSTSLSPAYDYETLLQGADAPFPSDAISDETQALGLCYTSATTGKPKGVVYSHRGIYLHSMAVGLANTMGLSEDDTVMPIVPMFHANAWGLPFAAIWFGSRLVLPGPAPSPAVLLELITSERVSVAAGVPTIWMGVLKELQAHPRATSLRMVLCGGSSAPASLIRTYEEQFHIPFVHAYGMTETSPLVVYSRLKSYQQTLSADQRYQIRATQGCVVPGIEVRLAGESGDVPFDGHHMGELLLRGPWIADSYYHDDRSASTFIDGWLHTGDVAVIDPEGFIRLVDRTKDLIKSGGEWISSVDLENALMAHPAVFEAAVLGVPHPRWDERPLAFVVRKEGLDGVVDKAALLEFLRPQFAKWWLPDDIIFVPEVPKTSVGKFLKRALRDEYQGYLSGDSQS